MERSGVIETVSEEVRNEQASSASELKVYRKKGEWGYWYSATTSGGKRLNIKFDEELQSQIPDLPAFAISEVMGSAKERLVESEEGIFSVTTYYVTSCKFSKIKGEALPL